MYDTLEIDTVILIYLCDLKI